MTLYESSAADASRESVVESGNEATVSVDGVELLLPVPLIASQAWLECFWRRVVERSIEVVVWLRAKMSEYSSRGCLLVSHPHLDGSPARLFARRGEREGLRALTLAVRGRV